MGARTGHNACATVSISRSTLRARTKLFAALSVVAAVSAVVLSCYAVFIRAEAASLLKDLTGLTVGTSTESDVEQLTRKHSRYLISRETSGEAVVTSFKVQNKWLSSLGLEPYAFFGASVSVKDGHAHHISVWLIRSMDTFPTFQGSAGMVDEYTEYPQYLSRYGHFAFPTPVGKPYLRVLLDSHASPIQRRRAFAFSFDCLTKPGGGCDLPCDYLPLAWQDWQVALRDSGLFDVFNQHYPNSSRCKEY